MARFTTFAAHKGGVGKTTVACNIAGAMAQDLDRVVLLIDLDGQANATTRMLKRESDEFADHSLVHFLQTGDFDSIVHQSPHHENIFVIPVDWWGMWNFDEDECKHAHGAHTTAGNIRELLKDGSRSPIAKWRHPVSGRPFDEVIIDSPPGAGRWQVAAFALADGVVLVADPELDAYTGAIRAYEFMRSVIEMGTNPMLQLDAVLVNRFISGRGDPHQWLKRFEQTFEGKVAKSQVPNVAAISAASTRSEIAQTYNGAGGRVVNQMFKQVTEELIAMRGAPEAASSPLLTETTHG